jgi:hypothetical protein
MTSSTRIPYAKPYFHHGRPIPHSPFSNWLHQESLTPPGEPHPRAIRISTNWLDGTESFKNLLLAAHSSVDLSSTLQTFVTRRGAHLSATQRIGIESYQDERKNGHFGHIRPPEDEGAMKRFYEYFNDIFFCGCLEGLCAIKFCNDSDHFGVGADSLGVAITPVTSETHRQQIPDGYSALIKIKDQSSEAPLLDEEARWKSYLSTLLHEMLHVFFGIYECTCSVSCRKQHAEEIGRGGHRTSWQFAALTIEEATLPLLGEMLDLSRKLSFEDDKEFVNTIDAKTRWKFSFP